MQYEIKFSLSPKFMKKVFWQEIIISQGWYILFLGIMVILISVVGKIEGVELWWAGFFTGSYAWFILAVIIAYLRTEKNAKLYKDVLRTMVFHEDYITQTGLDTACNVNWRIYTQLRIRKNAWIFYMNRNDYYVVPSDSIDDELGSFIIRKITENKGNIKDYRNTR